MMTLMHLCHYYIVDLLLCNPVMSPIIHVDILHVFIYGIQLWINFVFSYFRSTAQENDRCWTTNTRLHQ